MEHVKRNIVNLNLYIIKFLDGFRYENNCGSCQFAEGCISNDRIADCFCTTTVNEYSVFGDIEWLWSSSPKDKNAENAYGVAFNNASIFCDSKQAGITTAA